MISVCSAPASGWRRANNPVVHRPMVRGALRAVAFLALATIGLLLVTIGHTLCLLGGHRHAEHTDRMRSPAHTSRRNEFLARRWQGCSGRWPRSMCLNPPSRARLRRHTASSGQNSGRLLAGRQVTLRLEPTLLHVIADGSCCAPFRSPWRRRGRARLGGVPHREAIRVPVRQREAHGLLCRW
jgi:hypothetical protein